PPLRFVTNASWHFSCRGDGKRFNRSHRTLKGKVSMSKFHALVSIVSIIGLASTSLAATSATVPLSGTVTTTLQVTSSTAPSASTLNLMGGQQIVKVADVSMSTNNE